MLRKIMALLMVVALGCFVAVAISGCGNKDQGTENKGDEKGAGKDEMQGPGMDDTDDDAGDMEDMDDDADDDMGDMGGMDDDADDDMGDMGGMNDDTGGMDDE